MTDLAHDVIRVSDRAFPPRWIGRTIAQIRAASPLCAAELSTPFAVLDEDALSNNLEVMARWCAARGVELHPHAKTTMSPALFARQLAAGATGLSAATPAQARFIASCGVRSLHLAGEIVQPHEAAWFASWLADTPGAELLTWVDSPDAVRIVAQAAEAAGVVIDALVEVGAPGGRCGVRTADQLAAVTSAVAGCRGVRLRGAAGYEGSVAGRRDASGLAAVRGYLDRLGEVARTLASSGAVEQPITVSAGGSMFFDQVAAAFVGQFPRVIVRAGCYLLHDHGLYADNAVPAASLDGGTLTAALTVWASVVSRPEPSLAILDAGRRDLSYDQGLPVPLAARQHDGSRFAVAGSIRALNDQHTYLELSAGTDLAVGDRVQLGVSHPCTTMDKWSRLPVARADGTLADIVSTWF